MEGAQGLPSGQAHCSSPGYVNECQRYPGRLCGHKCENTLGSYLCSCSVGFRLSADGRSCEDINECSSSPCSQECANVYGSYQCYCRRGYQLSDVDGVTCEGADAPVAEGEAPPSLAATQRHSF
ncbi:hypothetical protein P7K49_003179 [Saguinus oedipus]|uniref:EGF-like domain-containing protein n=1 Tax=Saguinus oedipus TaxID=9490 RepID=A0ABQ9WM62_SAGOE|nr:hypothetical protein P7K49_003179 [Saguinus oedipus]